MAAEAVAVTFSSSGEAALAANLIRRLKFRSSGNFAGSRLEQEFESSIVRGGRASSRRDQELEAVLKLSLNRCNFKHLIKSAASAATRLFKFRAPDQVDCQRSLPGRLKSQAQAPDQVSCWRSTSVIKNSRS